MGFVEAFCSGGFVHLGRVDALSEEEGVGKHGFRIHMGEH